MHKILLSTLAGVAALAFAPASTAATLFDTGTPGGSAVGALVFDGSDWIAAQLTFADVATIDAIAGHILGGTAGETFDISLFSGDTRPQSLLFTTTATYGAAGWNGATGLGWSVAPGLYWVEFEVNSGDTLGTTSTPTGPLFDVGVAHPLPTSTTPDGGFTYDAGAPSIGLQVSTVPWPASASTMLAGLALLSALGLARRRA